METKKYKTKTRIINRRNIKVDGTWEIALDIGYSSVKLFSPNKIVSFPSYAKNVGTYIDWANGIPEDAIMYKENGSSDIWLIGEEAYNLLNDGDTSDSESSLFGRDRYYSPLFKTLCECSLGIALLSNNFGSYSGEDLVIQTGLPQQYMNDSSELINALSGKHSFSLKLGSENWIDYNFSIQSSSIFVMSQPKGSLLSVCLNSDGQMVKNARDILHSSVLVFDPGFGTLDLFELNNGCVTGGETIDSLGMKQVFKETLKLIKEKYGKELTIPALQKYLSEGRINTYNRRSLTSSNHDFAPLLEQASQKICLRAISMLSERDLSSYRYLIVTGGTGAAWAETIKEKMKGLSTLNICFANTNDTSISIIFSNVRGYYMNRYGILAKERSESMKKGA